MRVKEVLDFVLVQVGAARKGEIPTDLRAHALDALNMAYEQVWNLFPWDQSKIFELEATTADGEITLPSYVDNVQAARVSDKPLAGVGVMRVSNFYPTSLTTAGTPWEFIYQRPDPVLTQPSAAINVRVVSTSTADTSTVGSVRVVGMAAGVMTTEDLALNGTTNVTGSVSFTEIIKITKPVTTGRITVKDSSNTEYGTIAPWETTPAYPRYRLVPPVSETTTVTFQCLRRFEWLVSDNDAILPPQMVKPVVHLLAATMFRKYGEMDRAAAEDALAADSLRTVEANENVHNDKTFLTVPTYGMFGDFGTDAGSGGWPYYATS